MQHRLHIRPARKQTPPLSRSRALYALLATFHHYLRHKGRLPVRFANKPEILRKWEFVDAMAGRIS